MTTTPVPLPDKPTQSKHPWRATVRTLFAVIVGLAASYGFLVQLLGLNTQWHWVAVGAVVAAAITRAMANPVVELALQKYLPWLSAQPRPKPEHLA